MQTLKIIKANFNFELSYVAFLDVLGFRTLVSSTRPEDKEKVAVYFGAIKVFPQLLRDSGDSLKIASISDSLVLCLRCDNDSSGEQLIRFCESVGVLQGRLVEHDIWIRGGISVGDIHVEEDTNLVLGEGLVRAYDLESKHAKYPRIVLDTALVQQIGRQSNREFLALVNRGTEFGGPTILYDWFYRPDVGVRFEQDVPFFLDYLSPTVHNSNIREKILYLVEANLSKASFEHYPKYDWVRRYLMSLYEGPARYGNSDILYKELDIALRRLAGA